MQIALMEIKATLAHREVVDVAEKWMADTKKHHQKLYSEALNLAGLHDGGPEDPDMLPARRT